MRLLKHFLIYLRIIFALTGFVLAIYGIITNNFALTPYMFLFLGAALMLASISEFQLKRKKFGYFYFIISLFIFSVSIQGFLLT